jgi:hypothetical protein
VLDGDLDEAVRLTDEVLRADPQHAQARWNRGLALAGEGLPLAAAAELEQVTDPAWADEARTRAAALRDEAGDRARAWYDARTAGYAMVQGGAVLPAATARRFPGTARLFFYDALRTAETDDRLDELAPIAAALDGAFGGDQLVRDLEAARARPAAARTALVAEYRHFLAGDTTLDQAGWERWLADARRAGADDLVLGALVVNDDVAAHLDEYARLAAATGDPWFAKLAAEQRGLAALAGDDLAGAERTWIAASAACAAAPVAYRCALIDRHLAGLYKRSHRFADARRYGRRALDAALRDGEHGVVLEALVELADIELFGDRYAMARAYVDEARLGAPDDCTVASAAARLRAEAALLERRFDAARDEYARAPACPQAVVTANAAALAVDLARDSADAADVAAAAAVVARYRERAAGPAEQLLADFLAARLAIDRDPAAAAALRDVLDRAASLDDALADKVAVGARVTLAADRAGRGDWAGFFAEVSPDGATAAGTCAIAAIADDARVAVAVRGADGALAGELTETRAPLSAPDLVPPSLRARLDGCDDVVVLALAPVLGLAELLPRTVAWSYRVGTGAGPSTLPPRRVVVADARPPDALGLPHLSAWHGSTADVFLRGAEAQPARVLAEMQDATEIEIHAHGLVDLSQSRAPVIALSPGADGAWALTADAMRGVELRGAPLVVLADCEIAALAPYEALGLPTAMIRAGARAVIASPDPIDDREAGPFFEAVMERTRHGTSVARAIAAEAELHAHPWVSRLLVFE